jgi:hypothetical protein
MKIKGLGIVALLLGTLLYGAGQAAPELNNKYHDSSNCKACHQQIVSEWKDSYHAKSHYSSNEYLRKSMDYVGRKDRRSANSIKVQCAACHNPRIAITETGMDYEIQAAMKLDNLSSVNKALESDELSEGINCLVCHNVDKVHDDLDESKRGVHRISWNPVGTMSGPFADAKSPYHKTQYRDFFGEDPKTLCFVCHANDRSTRGLVFANTQQEYKDVDKQCADCHMSPKKPGVASNLPIDNGKPKQRMVREHGFVGAHNEWLWEGALRLNVVNKGNELLVTMKNDNPHNIPTGFGSRELLLEVTYMSGSKVLKKQSMSLTTYYKDKRGKPTIPHLAAEASEDLSVPAQGQRTVKFAVAEGAGLAEVKLYYKLVNDEVHKMLKLKEPIWSKKMFIDKVNHRF